MTSVFTEDNDRFLCFPVKLITNQEILDFNCHLRNSTAVRIFLTVIILGAGSVTLFLLCHPKTVCALKHAMETKLRRCQRIALTGTSFALKPTPSSDHASFVIKAEFQIRYQLFLKFRCFNPVKIRYSSEKKKTCSCPSYPFEEVLRSKNVHTFQYSQSPLSIFKVNFLNYFLNSLKLFSFRLDRRV